MDNDLRSITYVLGSGILFMFIALVSGLGGIQFIPFGLQILTSGMAFGLGVLALEVEDERNKRHK